MTDEATEVDLLSGPKAVVGDGVRHLGRTVVLAMGTAYRHLEVKHAQRPY